MLKEAFLKNVSVVPKISLKYYKVANVVKSVQVETYNNLDQRQRIQNYFNIGHDNKKKNILWILIPGTGIETHEGGENIMHHVIWPWLSMTKVYRGRVEYNPDETIVSVSPPFGREVHEDDDLVQELYSKFNADRVVILN